MRTLLPHPGLLQNPQVDANLLRRFCSHSQTLDQHQQPKHPSSQCRPNKSSSSIFPPGLPGRHGRTTPGRVQTPSRIHRVEHDWLTIVIIARLLLAYKGLDFRTEWVRHPITSSIHAAQKLTQQSSNTPTSSPVYKNSKSCPPSLSLTPPTPSHLNPASPPTQPPATPSPPSSSPTAPTSWTAARSPTSSTRATHSPPSKSTPSTSTGSTTTTSR